MDRKIRGGQAGGAAIGLKDAELGVRAVANRERDCGQGAIPLEVWLADARTWQARWTAADGGRSWQVVFVPGHARCDGSVAASGSASVVECGASAGEEVPVGEAASWAARAAPGAGGRCRLAAIHACSSNEGRWVEERSTRQDAGSKQTASCRARAECK